MTAADMFERAMVLLGSKSINGLLVSPVKNDTCHVINPHTGNEVASFTGYDPRPVAERWALSNGLQTVMEGK